MDRLHPRIGFFSRTLHDRTGQELWKGILEGCRQKGFSVVAIKGGHLGQNPASILYYLARPESFDGFITWASTDTEKSTVDFYGRFGGKPLVCMTTPVPGHPVAVADSKHGMIELVEHFIEAHSCRKIAFVRGPDSHVYARERYEGYLETLEKHKIPKDDKIITPPGGWGIEDGAKAVGILLDQRALKVGKDIDAIITVSDNISIGVLNQLIRRGIKVPEDLALGGFNDTVEAKCTNPPLTSVAMPFILQGEKGVELIQAMLEGKKAPDESRFPANLVVGQSCGCRSKFVDNAASGVEYGNRVGKVFLQECIQDRKPGKKAPASNTEKEIKDWRDVVSSSMEHRILDDRALHQATHDQVHAQTLALLNSFHEEVSHGKKGAFLISLSEILRTVIASGGSLEAWQNVVSELRAGTIGFVKDCGVLALAEDLWQQARVMIGETAIRTKELQYLEKVKNEGVLRSIGASLITSYDIDKLMDILAESLERLEIPSFYLALYEESRFTLADPVCPEWSMLILAERDSKRIDLPQGGMRIRSSDFVPADLLPQGRQYSLVVESLHFQDIMLGYIVFETGPEEGSIYVSLRDQLSSALYGAVLLSERSQVKGLLEKTLATMRSKAEVVSAQSQKINTNVTGVSSSMEEMAASIREISAHIKTVMENVNGAESLANTASSDIGRLTESTSKIAAVVGLINDIAEMTNVLALNAAIEAAHAGASGRGFSVVAKEVKKLAAQTVASTAEIQNIVNKNVEGAEQTSQAIAKTREAIRKISELASSITAAISEQAQASSEVSSLLIDASQGTAEISRAISEIARLG